MILEYRVKHNEFDTIRHLLINKWHISHRLLTKLKKFNAIYLNNNNNIYIDYPLKKGDYISINLDFNESSENIVPIKMDLDIIYEDDCYIVINKPANMPVHPSALHFEDSLSNGIQYYFAENNIKTKIHPVNRLDMNTSGIVIFAKNEYVQEILISQMKNNIFRKEYIAVLSGNFLKKSGTINAPIARKKDSIIERCISKEGKTAITHYELIKNFDGYCIVRFWLETGRTHQIRVHCKHIGHPIIGDTLYGTASNNISRQALHAYKVRFVHPLTNKEVEYVAEIPKDILKFYK